MWEKIVSWITIIPTGEYVVEKFSYGMVLWKVCDQSGTSYFFSAQTTLGGIEDLAKTKEDVRIASGLPASYEIQCPPQQAIVKERTPAPHTPPPVGTDSDSNGEIQWERCEEEHIYRPPKLRPKVRWNL